MLHTYLRQFFCLRTFMVRNTTHTQTSVTYLLTLFLSTKTLIGGLMPPENVKLKHRLTQCLSLVRSNFTVTIQYFTSHYTTQRHCPESNIQLILLLTIYLRTYTIVLLIFHNGWTLSPDIIRRASGRTSVSRSTPVDLIYLRLW